MQPSPRAGWFTGSPIRLSYWAWWDLPASFPCCCSRLLPACSPTVGPPARVGGNAKLAMLQALALACLTLTGFIQVWHIMVLAVFSGAINSFDMPTRQAFTLEMVGRKEDLPNAIALNSSVFNASRLIGPSIAGLLISLVGEGTCFLLEWPQLHCGYCRSTLHGASLPHRSGPLQRIPK